MKMTERTCHFYQIQSFFGIYECAAVSTMPKNFQRRSAVLGYHSFVNIRIPFGVYEQMAKRKKQINKDECADIKLGNNFSFKVRIYDGAFVTFSQFFVLAEIPFVLVISYARHLFPFLDS